MLLAILEFLTFLFILFVILTQVVIPLFRGTKLFPFLSEETKIVSDIEEARQKNLEKELKKKLQDITSEKTDGSASNSNNIKSQEVADAKE